MPVARALYEQGLTRSEVLETIYGVDLPFEAALFMRDVVPYDDDERRLEASWGTLPWELMIPLDDGGPRIEIGRVEITREIRAFTQAPHVLLLGRTGYSYTQGGGRLIGYDLNELRAGRTTVVGLNQKGEIPEVGAVFAVLGPSLIAVFRDLVVRFRAQIERTLDPGPSMFDPAELEELGSHLAFLDKLAETGKLSTTGKTTG